jgi:hypothetical protein
MSALSRVEFVSDRMSYIILWVRSCDIIVVNVHAPTEDKTDMKDSFYKGLKCVFDKFPKYHMKIFVDFSAKVFWNQQLQMRVISNDNGVRVVNSATSINLSVKSTMFPCRNIQKIYLHISCWKDSQSHFEREGTAFKCTWCPILQGNRLW